MAILFLSHSSVDNERASWVKDRLAAAGFESVFLDVDEVGGIQPGRRWRDELTRRLRTADAIVFLGSAASAQSIWCAAELAMAKTLEKFVLAMQLDDSARHELLVDDQWVMFRGNLDETVCRVITALEQRPSRGDASRRYWDDTRSPFPGLRPFDIDDAGVFFGRDGFVEELVTVVDPVAALDHSSLIVVVGPSGAGKSSLVRAGLAPALLDRGRAGAGWLVVPPVVPALDTRRELGRSLRAAGLDGTLAESFLAGGLSLREAAAALVKGVAGIEKVLVVLDQAEELVDRSDRVEILAELADAALAGAGCRIVLTVREGYLARVLGGAELDGRVWSFPVTPMARAGLVAAIERPAQRADLDIDDGLVQVILDDVGSGEALPLLALALDRTYRSAIAEGVRALTLDRYYSCGGVAGAVARQAGEAVTRLGIDGEQRVIDVLVRMVTVDEDGGWIRRTLGRARLDDGEWQVVRALERARLVVVSGEDEQATAAVVHATIFSAWPPLVRALEAKAEDLRFERRLERDAIEWDGDGRPVDQLPSGDRYRQLLEFRRRQPDVALEGRTRDYLAAATRRSRNRRARVAAVSGLVGILAALASVFAFGQLQESSRRAEADRVADARQLVAQALSEPRFDRAMERGLDAVSEDPSRDVAEAVLGIVLREPAFRGYAAAAMPDAGRTVAWTPNGGLIAGDAGGRVMTFDRASTEADEILEADGTLIRALGADPNGRWIAAGDLAGRVRIWPEVSSPPLDLERDDGTAAHRALVADIVVVDSRRLVSAGHDGDVVLWDTSTGTPVWVVTIGAEVWSIAPLTGAESVVVGTSDGEVVAVALDDGAVRTIGRVTDGVHSLASIGDFVLAGDEAGAIWLLDSTPAAGQTPTTGTIVFKGERPVRSIVAVDAERVLTGWTDGLVRLIDRDGQLLDVFSAHDEPIRDIAYDPTTSWFAVTGDDGLVSQWDLDGASPLVEMRWSSEHDLVGDSDGFGRLYLAGTTQRLSRLDPLEVEPVALTDDFGESIQDVDVNDEGTVAAVAFADRALAIDATNGRVLAEVAPGSPVGGVALEGNRLVTAGDELVIVDLGTGAEERSPLPEEVTDIIALDAGADLIVAGGRADDDRGLLIVWRRDESVPLVESVGQAGVAVSALDIDAEHGRLVIGRSDGRVEVRELERLGTVDIAFTRHDVEITDVAFAPSSETIVSLDSRGVAWLWSSDFGTSYAQPISTGLYGRRIVVNAEGETLTVIGRRGVAQVRLDAANIFGIGCQLAALECDEGAPELLSVLRER